MSAVLHDVNASMSLQEVCMRLGEMLHVEGPVAPEVARRALADERYAHYLLVTRENPRMLATILAAATGTPPPAMVMAPPRPSPQSTSQLLGRAAGALVRWGKAGFTNVDNATYARRWSACQACDSLVEPPDTTVYTIATGVLKGDRRVCSACGCVASRKARLSTESCPRRDPRSPDLTLWGEPND